MVFAALTVHVVFLVLIGFLGKWRSDVHFGVHDYIYVYTGGAAWRDGQNPYVYATLHRVAEERT